MELQWPLILFTAFIAWSAGLFGTQCVYALRKKCPKAQMPALITSVVLLAIGGIAVFFHLQHWERIFNGFGHLTSGITQELIGIVVIAVLMVLYFVMIRRSEEGNLRIPKWLSIAGIVVAVALVCIMGHSYVMPSRPAWDSVMQIASLVGSACALGPATMAVIAEICGNQDAKVHGLMNIIGQIANAVLAVGYLIAMHLSASSFTSVDYWFDPTSPTQEMTDATTLSPFSGDALGLSIAVIVLVVVGIVIALVGTYLCNKKGKKCWRVFGVLAAVAALASAICLRCIFYIMGVSVYPFF